MAELRDRIESLLNDLLPVCESWIQERDGGLQFVDPNDGEEISAHYGATHMAAALILRGKMSGENTMYQNGISLLNSILNRWELNVKRPEFHFDFNNFALCVIADFIKEDDVLYHRILHTVLHTEDSNHSTTNWLPMRWYVNQKRYEWTNENKYKDKCRKCRIGLEKATNADGGIEDRIPKGISFNLQYDVATVGVIQFLRQRGVDYDLSRELSFLLHAVAPDGDINYQGRGTNQIFAWGLWVYLLASAGRNEDLSIALDYLEPRVLTMFQKHNLMLNDYEGVEKYLWWDYHYCSVYCAHFLFWLLMAIQDYNKAVINDCIDVLPEVTGLHIFRTEEAFVATFDGRKEYLAERGPIVCAIWTKKYGMICKGNYGPWLGHFGNRYTFEAVNHFTFGIIQILSFFDRIPFSYIRKILYRFSSYSNNWHKCNYRDFSVNVHDDFIMLSYYYPLNSPSFCNLFLLNGLSKTVRISIKADGKSAHLYNIGQINNQYGKCDLLQSPPIRANKWLISIFY